ncbi:cardiolipin synthase ClsB [Bordetella sp. LUAb4]|uniref:cardiolipin synthase ClsB n=1 Tax=Bordetella sp. LUAb4 TaxID=2843195 RepID=UPI0021044494|nr:cardiolipin synthase ClsB [Bordetella sp. LUAb4]
MSTHALRLDWTEGNAIRLLMNGADFFPALCEAIDDARHHVHLETYIFLLDRTGRKVLEALERAAGRGVRVRVVIDGFGSQEQGDAVAARIKAAGGDCRIFRPEPHWIKRLLFSRSRLRRLHRKVAIVDSEVAYIGGINIQDDYDDVALTEEIAANPRFDFAVEVRGPLVPYAVHAQDLLWVRLNWASVRRNPKQWRRPTQWRRLKKPDDAPAQPPAGKLRAALVLRDNLRFRNTFERAYLYGIARARDEILIASAYFFPGVRFRKALARAAARGVRVRLLLQGKIEYRMQYYATHALYEELLRAGIEIYEYMPSFLHAKVAVIDHMATVGSSNLDPFSLLLAREANVVVDDAGFAEDLHTRLEAEIARGGRLVRSVEYARRGWIRRCVDTVSYTVLRLGVALTGRSGRY